MNSFMCCLFRKISLIISNFYNNLPYNKNLNGTKFRLDDAITIDDLAKVAPSNLLPMCIVFQSQIVTKPKRLESRMHCM